MSLSISSFHSLAEKISRINGISLKRAREYVSLIGDTPELDEDGTVAVATDSGKILARLKWPVEE